MTNVSPVADADTPIGTRPAIDALGGRADERIAIRAPAALRPWNEAGVLAAADVHVARRLAGLDGEDDPDVLLGAALAVRALRLGHVCVDLSTVASVATSDVEGVDPAELPWPDPDGWLASMTASGLVATGEDGLTNRPLRRIGPRVYLDRYWRQERQVAAELLTRSISEVSTDLDQMRSGLERLWVDGPGSDEQRLAAAVATTRRFAVVAGGPGTGKTTTVARILALLAEQTNRAGRPFPRIALAAPTGRAAARMEEAVHEEASRLDVDEAVREWLVGTSASTIHRLLGRRPGSESRFRHDHSRRLPHDTVIVDETSMVSLSLMAGLLDALRPEARLVLVGDPEQLASVEAGAVLGDIAGPAGPQPRQSATDRLVTLLTPPAAAERSRMRAASSGETTAPSGETTAPEPAIGPPGPSAWRGDGIVVLHRVHRFGGGIAELAGAIQAGDPDRAISLLETAPELTLVERDGKSVASVEELAPVRRAVVDTFSSVHEAAVHGEGGLALGALGRVRVLCAHRRGPAGVTTWNELIWGWLRLAIRPYGSGGLWYTGRPLLITANDYELRLFNGDTGVVGTGPDGQTAAAFERAGGVEWISPARLPPAETLYATTVHKAQGSQFDEVVVVLPETTSALLSRQLLYTAVTRARLRVTLLGSPEAVVAAINRPISRASGLRERLWGPQPETP